MSAWHAYDKMTNRRVRRFAGTLDQARELLDTRYRRRWLELLHDGSGETWERKGGEWRQTAPPDREPAEGAA